MIKITIEGWEEETEVFECDVFALFTRKSNENTILRNKFCPPSFQYTIFRAIKQEIIDDLRDINPDEVKSEEAKED